MPFVVFEGAEGVGKTTQIAALARILKCHGVEPVVTREPGGTPFAERLRALFKATDADGDDPTAWTELFLVAAARAQHLERVVRPALTKGLWVLCDRFLDSAYVYQGIRAGLGCTTVRRVHDLFMIAADAPDATFVLDLEPSLALARVGKRSQNPSGADSNSTAPDRMDQSGIAGLTIMREGFLHLIDTKEPYPHNVHPERVLLDASAEPEAITQAVWHHVQHLLPRPERP
jgi:dTMP kinase